MKTQTAQRTPGPWSADTMAGMPIVYGSDRTHILTAHNKYELAKANAAFIVKAVNCHEELIKALGKAQTHLLRLNKGLAGATFSMGDRDMAEFMPYLCDVIARAEGK